MANIVILEDNFELALHWQTLLEEQQHCVRSTTTVEHALKLVDQQMPDLIITDMLIRDSNQLKAEGGLLFISRLNLNTHFQGPILGISGFKKGPYVEVTPLDIAKQLGISMTLYKPVSPTQILEAVEYLLPHP